VSAVDAILTRADQRLAVRGCWDYENDVPIDDTDLVRDLARTLRVTRPDTELFLVALTARLLKAGVRTNTGTVRDAIKAAVADLQAEARR
jgi:hypothetical protein